jgi:hypothetical protein
MAGGRARYCTLEHKRRRRDEVMRGRGGGGHGLRCATQMCYISKSLAGTTLVLLISFGPA